MALVDFHSHLLFDVDHGVSTRDRMVEIFKYYRKAGFEAICLTPHLFHPSVITKVENIREHYHRAKADARSMGLEVYLGSELYVGAQINLNCIPIDGRYALVEFSPKMQPLNLYNRLNELKKQGLEIFVAHIERYEWLSLESKAMSELQSLGCYLQVNVEDYDTRKVKAYLEAEMVDMIVSDNHGSIASPGLLASALSKEGLVADRMESIIASLCSDDDIT